MTSSDKIVNVQSLRGAAAFGVLVAHLASVEGRYGGGGALLPNWFDLGVSGVDLFFVISGFVMVYVTRNISRTRESVFTFLYRRVTRIYPLYWVVSLAVLAVFLARPDFVNSSQNNEADILASFLLVPQDKFPLLMVGWTLTHELYFYLVFTVLIAAPRRILPFLLVAWGGVVLAGELLGLGELNAWTGVLFNPLTFEFLLGCGVALVLFRGAPPRGGALVLGVGGALLGGVILLRIAGVLDPVSSAAVRTSLFGLPFAMLLYGVIALENTGSLKAPDWACRLGDASYSLYLTHILTASALGRLWALGAGPGWWDNAIALVFIAGAAIAVAFATYFVFERPMLQFTRRRESRVASFLIGSTLAPALGTKARKQSAAGKSGEDSG